MRAIYESIQQICEEYDCDTPTEYARAAYDCTKCGVWTVFCLSDGSEIASHDLGEDRDTMRWAVDHVKGIKHGTIVEGSDAEFTADPLWFPFRAEELEGTWKYLETEVDLSIASDRDV